MASVTVTSKDREENKKKLVSEEPVTLGSTYYKNGESPQSAFQNYYNDVTGGGQTYKQIYSDGSKEYAYAPNIPQGVDKNGDGGLSVSYGANGKLVNSELQDHNAVWTYGGKVYDNKIGSDGKRAYSKVYNSMKNLPTYTGIDKDKNPTQYLYGEGANVYNPNQVVRDFDYSPIALSGVQLDTSTLNYTPYVNVPEGYTPLGNYFDAGLDGAAMAQIQAYQQAYQAAQKEYQATGSPEAYNAMQGAHAAAEAIRSQYGYSGGLDGSDYIGFGYGQQAPNTPNNNEGGFYWNEAKPEYDFDYERPAQYDSEYTEKINELLNQILNRDNFSYSPDTDPLFQQYKAQYLREGQRAMNDTLASAAAGAGGMNSYAISAASQAQNYYNSQLTDKIPELQQLAYSMYLDDIDQQVRDLGLLEKMDETQYNRYRDFMGDWENDRDFSYGMFRDDMYDYNTDRTFAYGQFRDDVADSQWQQKLDYEMQRDLLADGLDSRDTAYNRAMDYISMGVMPSAELLAEAGISAAEAQSFINKVNAPKTTSSSSSPKAKDDDGDAYKTKDKDKDLDDSTKTPTTPTTENKTGAVETNYYYDAYRTARGLYERGSSYDSIKAALLEYVNEGKITGVEALRIAENFDGKYE